MVADGARPGDPRGSILVTGHTVSTGGAALDRLEALRPGDAVTVRTRRDVLEYAVRRVAIIEKGLVAQRAGGCSAGSARTARARGLRRLGRDETPEQRRGHRPADWLTNP